MISLIGGLHAYKIFIQESILLEFKRAYVQTFPQRLSTIPPKTRLKKHKINTYFIW